MVSTFSVKDLASPVHPVCPDCMPGDSEISSALTAAMCKWEIVPELVCCALPRTVRGKEGHLAKDQYSFPSLSPPITRWDYFPVASLLSPHRKSK